MIKRNILANFLGQGWNAAIGLFFVPIYIYYLGLEVYGIVGLVAVLRVWLSQFNVGMTPTLTREMARYHAGAHTPESIGNLLRSMEWVCACLAVVIFAIVWTGSDYLAYHWVQTKEITPTEVSTAVKIAAGLLAFQFSEGVYRGALIGLQKQVHLNTATICFSSLRHGGAWAVLTFHATTVQAYFAWECAVSLLQLLAMATLVHVSLPRPARAVRFSLEALRSIWRFSAGMLGITTLAILLTQVDKILLSRLIPLNEFGLYTLATTATSALSLLSSPVLQAVYPRIVQLVARKESHALVSTYHLVSQVVTALAAPVLVLLIFFPEGLLFTWTNNIEVAFSAAPLVMVLAMGTFSNIVMRTPYEYMLAHGWTSLSFWINVAAVLLLIPALLLVVPLYGAIGAAYIWLALNIGYIVFTVQLMHRKILEGEKMRWYTADVFAPLGLAMMVGFLWSWAAPDVPSSRIRWGFFLAAVSFTSLAVVVTGSPVLRRAALRCPSAFRERKASQ